MGLNVDNPHEEVEINQQSKRKRIGRIVLMMGLALIVIVITSSLLISVVAAYSGIGNPIASFEYLQFILVISGILMVLVGLAAVLLPEGPSKDGVWIMKMGPMFGNS
jgi:archaellum biogenesis protein FlaJ (TadC family)